MFGVELSFAIGPTVVLALSLRGPVPCLVVTNLSHE